MTEPDSAMYWRRRAVAGAGVVGVVLLVVWALSGSSGTGAQAQGGVPRAINAGSTQLTFQPPPDSDTAQVSNLPSSLLPLPPALAAGANSDGSGGGATPDGAAVPSAQALAPGSTLPGSAGYPAQLPAGQAPAGLPGATSQPGAALPGATQSGLTQPGGVPAAAPSAPGALQNVTPAQPNAALPDATAAQPSGTVPNLNAAQPNGATPNLNAAQPSGTVPNLNAAQPSGTVPNLNAAQPNGTVPNLNAAQPNTPSSGAGPNGALPSATAPSAGGPTAGGPSSGGSNSAGTAVPNNSSGLPAPNNADRSAGKHPSSAGLPSGLSSPPDQGASSGLPGRPDKPVKPEKPAKPPKPTKPTKPGQAFDALAAAPTVRPPAPAATPACSDANIGLVAQVNAASFKIGQRPEFRLVVANLGSVPCTRDLDPGLQELQVNNASGARVWDSNDCDAAHHSQVKVLEPGKPVVFPLAWAARSSSPGCSAAERAALPAGSYQLTGKLGRLTSGAAQFALTK